MKIFVNILLFFAVALLIFNLTKVDFEKTFEGDSAIALVCAALSICAALLLTIFKISKKIEAKRK